MLEQRLTQLEKKVAELDKKRPVQPKHSYLIKEMISHLSVAIRTITNQGWREEIS